MKIKSLILIILLIFTTGFLEASKEKERVILLIYEIYDIRYCDLIPDPFRCRECLSRDMQVARKITFREGEIFREVVCVPYKHKYLH